MEDDKISGKEFRAYCEQCDRKFEAGAISPTEYLLAVERIERKGYVVPASMLVRANRIEKQLIERVANNFFEVAEMQRKGDNYYRIQEQFIAQKTAIQRTLQNLRDVA